MNSKSDWFKKMLTRISCFNKIATANTDIDIKDAALLTFCL